MGLGGEPARSRLFTWGLPEFDEYLSMLKEGYTLLIFGHPGSGKTTLAAKLAYENMRKFGYKVLYICTNETEDKFLEIMRRLGMDFRKFSDEGKFRFIEIPLISEDFTRDEIVDITYEEVIKYSPDILVIDSITPFLESFSSDMGRRAFLRAGPYRVVSEMRGLLVLVADLPHGRESPGLGDIEFVADGVLATKVSTEAASLRRWVEIRKLRGSPYRISKMYFRIVDGVGPVVVAGGERYDGKYVRAGELLTGMPRVTSVLGQIHRGTHLLFLYPLGTELNALLSYVLVAMSVKLRHSVTVITFGMHPRVFMARAVASALAAGMFGGDVRSAIDSYLRYVKVLPIDLDQADLDLLPYEICLSREVSEADVTIYPDLKLLYDFIGNTSRFNRVIYPIITRGKHRGITTVFFFTEVKDFEELVLPELSDIIYRIVPMKPKPKSLSDYAIELSKAYPPKGRSIPVSELSKYLLMDLGIGMPQIDAINNYLGIVTKLLEKYLGCKDLSN